MRARELVVASTLLLSTHADADCPGRAASSASGWGFTCDSAISDAENTACETCRNNGERCGDIVGSSCDDGWFYSTATVMVLCCERSW